MTEEPKQAEPLSEEEIEWLTRLHGMNPHDIREQQPRMLATIRELQAERDRANAWGMKESVDLSNGAERIAGVAADLRVENDRLRVGLERLRDFLAACDEDCFGGVEVTQDTPGFWVRDELIAEITTALAGKEPDG